MQLQMTDNQGPMSELATVSQMLVRQVQPISWLVWQSDGPSWSESNPSTIFPQLNTSVN